MGHRLLFICHANVCRSPLMAATFSATVRPHGGADAWHVGSAGVDARGGSLCAVSGEHIDAVLESADAAAFRAAFMPSSPSESWLDTAEIILTATRAERSAIAHIDPALRDHTFTLREAVALGSAEVQAYEEEHETLPRFPEANTLKRYAAMLHERRGLVDLMPPRSRFALPRRRRNPLDLPDVHHLPMRAHRNGLTETRDAARTFAEQVRAFVGTEK